MKLGINGWRIHGNTGVPRYVQNLVSNWTQEIVDSHIQRINLYVPKSADEVRLPSVVNECVLGPEHRILVWENLRLSFVDDDVLFCPSNSRPLVCRAKTVVTVHDALPGLYPWMFPRPAVWLYSALYGWSARNAAIVITVSEAAKCDIVKCWKVPPSRIRVIYSAAAEIFRPLTDEGQITATRRKYVGSSDPFFLVVGKITGRRSMPLLFEAFAELKRRTSLPHKLVVVGSNLYNLALPSMLHELDLSEHVQCPGFVPDEELSHLYNAAEALISPVIYETMSLPAMEAQATGTPVIGLDVQALREITGGAAVLFQEARVPDLFDAMSRIASDAELRSELAEEGLKNSRLFSWSRCAAETLEVLHKAATMDSPRL